MLKTQNYGFNKPELSDSPPDITVMNSNWDTIDKKIKENTDNINKNSSEICKLVLQKNENRVTVFNLDGSINETVKNGNDVLRTKITTFPSSTQIVETILENGVNTIKTTTFNLDGTIKEEVV